MLRLIGAAMLVLSSGGVGICLTTELRQSLLSLEKTKTMLRRIETEVCLRHRPLPDILQMIRLEFPDRFSHEQPQFDLSERTFQQVWADHIERLELPAAAIRAICQLGEELSGGTPPETAFHICAEELSLLEETLRIRLEEKGKVYIASGFAAGCMIAIAVL